MSAISEIMIIDVDFKIFMNASHSVFQKKITKTQIKLKPKVFLKIADTLLPRMLRS